MNRTDILHALDTEIDRLQQARTLLADAPDVLTEAVAAPRGPGRPRGSAKSAAKETKAPIVKKRTLSPEGRASIAAAQKARWARLQEPAKKKATPPSSTKKAANVVKKAVKKAAGKKAVAKKATAKQAAPPFVDASAS